MSENIRRHLLIVAVLGGLAQGATGRVEAQQAAGLPEIDPARLKQAGIRRYAGTHLTLYSDAEDEKVRELPAVFDRAVGEWCKYFGLKPDRWQVRGHIMVQKERFIAVGLWREKMPPFLNGFAFADAFWMYDQPKSDYYRRHLMLHEGVHAFMFTRFENCGPAWYMEGMAELLATHRLDEDAITLPYFPANKEQVPMWGRIKIVQDGAALGRPMTLDGILDYPPQAHLQNEPYGWCWALAAFLDGHPRTQARFRKLPALLREPSFNTQVRAVFAKDWPEIVEEWQLFVQGLEYGYDLPRMAVVAAPAQAAAAVQSAKVQADRGWQSSGIEVAAGIAYQITARGRYQIAKTTKAWECEPGGVSIRYHAGRPLGELLVSIRTDSPGGLLNPLAIGLGATLTPETRGTLYFRVNDSPAELADNLGELSVEVRRH